jgi:hypothetical protein
LVRFQAHTANWEKKRVSDPVIDTMKFFEAGREATNAYDIINYHTQLIKAKDAVVKKSLTKMIDLFTKLDNVPMVNQEMVK